MLVHIISDTHCRHEELKIPDVDMVIHCGDESNSFQSNHNIAEAHNFLYWFNQLDIKYKIFVPGNHSVAIERGLLNLQEYPTIKFLIHQETEIEGLRIFGSPYTPTFGNWAYMRNRNKLGELWKQIPDDIQILVTHGPANGILDLAYDFNTNEIVQTGCTFLYKKIMNSSIEYHFSGHIHESKKLHNNGILYHKGKTFVNAACLNHETGEILQGHTIQI
jgi:predicted phosphodiesterase